MEETSLYLLFLAGTNYYNAKNHTVRVQKGGELYDCWLQPSTFQPHPDKTMALVFTTDAFFEHYSIASDKKDFSPGTMGSEGKPKDLGSALAFLVSKEMIMNTSHGNSSMANSNIKDATMTDDASISVSVSSPIPPNYTNPKEDNDDNLKFRNIGIFINDKNKIMIKGTGASITIGDEGIHIGGTVSFDNATPKTGLMVTNPFRNIIPPTLPTAAIAGFKYFIDPSKFYALADAGMKFMDIAGKVGKVVKIVTSAISR